MAYVKASNDLMQALAAQKGVEIDAFEALATLREATGC